MAISSVTYVTSAQKLQPMPCVHRHSHDDTAHPRNDDRHLFKHQARRAWRQDNALWV